MMFTPIKIRKKKITKWILEKCGDKHVILHLEDRERTATNSRPDELEILSKKIIIIIHTHENVKIKLSTMYILVLKNKELLQFRNSSHKQTEFIKFFHLFKTLWKYNWIFLWSCGFFSFVLWAQEPNSESSTKSSVLPVSHIPQSSFLIYHPLSHKL